MARVLGLILLAAAIATPVIAQTTNATCAVEFDWMSNSANQSPCLVAAYLQGACSPSQIWKVVALPDGNRYNPPAGALLSACTCSSAVYDTMAACSACQGQSWYPWPVYNAACGSLLSTTYYPASVAVPVGTVIPPWAQRLGDNWSAATFNLTEAKAIASGSLDPSATGPGASTVSSTGSSTAPSNSASQTSAPDTTSPPSSSPPIGAIVGGVVGGILGLLLIGTLAYYLISKNRREARKLAVVESEMVYPQSPPPMAFMGVPQQRPAPAPMPSFTSANGGSSGNPSYHGHHPMSPSLESNASFGTGVAPSSYFPANHAHNRSLSQTLSMTHGSPQQAPPQMTVTRSNTHNINNSISSNNNNIRAMSPMSDMSISSPVRTMEDADPFFLPTAAQQHAQGGVHAPQPVQLSEKAQLRERDRLAALRGAAGMSMSPAPPAYTSPPPEARRLLPGRSSTVGDDDDTWGSGSSTNAAATGGGYSGDASSGRDGEPAPTNEGLARALSSGTTGRGPEDLQSYLGLRLATQTPGAMSTYGSTVAGHQYGEPDGDWPDEKR